MPTPIQTKDDVPTASPGWWQTFSTMAAARPKAIEDRLYDCYIHDRNLFATDPDRTTIIRKLARDGARALMRPTLLLFLLGLMLTRWTATVHAYSPVSESPVVVSTCSDRDELAGVLMVEGGAQPTETIIRMGQIIKAEADSRGITICALTHLTHFVSVRHYIEAHPNSYAAHRFANPPDWALDIASGVLLGQFEDIRDGAMHFDGDGMRIIFRQ